MIYDMDLLQRNAATWCVDTFNELHLKSARERGLRALEECMEAIQSAGLTVNDVDAIKKQVFNKPATPLAEINKEVGDALFTMLLFAECHNVHAGMALEDVINSAWDRQASIRVRHMLKYREENLDV